MMDLALDPRSMDAYAAARARHESGSNTGLPQSSGAPADLLLRTLGASETVTWFGWAHQVADGSPAWWIVALTDRRLIGVSPAPQPQVWAIPEHDWATEAIDTDVVLSIRAGGAPLRVRGAGIDATSLFHAPARTSATASSASVNSEDYEEEQKAKRLAQEYFDLSVTEFMKVAHAVTEHAATNSPIVAAVRTELDRVQRIVGDVGSRTVPLDEFTAIVDGINDATRRLCADLGIPATV